MEKPAEKNPYCNLNKLSGKVFIQFKIITKIQEISVIVSC